MPRSFSAATAHVLAFILGLSLAVVAREEPPDTFAAMAVALRQMARQASKHNNYGELPQVGDAHLTPLSSQQLVREIFHLVGFNDTGADPRLVDLFAHNHDGHCMNQTYRALFTTLENASKPGACSSLVIRSAPQGTQTTDHAVFDDGGFLALDYTSLARRTAKHPLGERSAVSISDAGAASRRQMKVAKRSSRGLRHPAKRRSTLATIAVSNVTSGGPHGQVYAQQGLVLLGSDRFNSSMQLDWPTFKSILVRAMSMNGIAARKQAYSKQHALPTDFSLRFDGVVSKKDPLVFSRFVKDLVTFLGGAVVDEGGLAGFVPFYVSGDEQTFEHLVEEVFGIASLENGWIRFGGEYAQLSEVGYAALLRYNQPDQLTPFVERAIRNLGVHVTKAVALDSFVPFFNGVCATEDFSSLGDELHRALTLPAECGGGWLQSNSET